MSWKLVAVLMIAEIVGNGMLSLPSSLAVVGIVPGVALIVFLGIFATYTSRLLVSRGSASRSIVSIPAVGVPIFNYLIGIAGTFWSHDNYHDYDDGRKQWARKWFQAPGGGGFICVAGTQGVPT
ncbi:hypothetical protein LX36DRAFT_674235 [Colletotrichum falcatum]|nr:hypothetical protein LX36DRAFT_674235 [Colletotrichum falcatum]